LIDKIAYCLKILREQAAYYLANDYGLLCISGKDAVNYLQSQTSNDVTNLEPGHGQLNCLLDRKAHVLAHFYLFKETESPGVFYLVARKEQIPVIVHHLDEMLFAAQVNFSDLSQQGKFIAIAGPRCNGFLYQFGIDVNLTDLPTLDSFEIKVGETIIRIFRLSLTGDPSYFLWIKNEDFPRIYESVMDSAKQLGFVELNNTAIEIARVEAGLPLFGIDFSSENLLPETGLESSTVSYTKGCFTGQEVLARVKSHGMVAKALVGLVIERAVLDQSHTFPICSAITVSGEEIGVLKSNVFSPVLNKIIAFAFLKRDYRVSEKKCVVQINNESVNTTVTIPPFIPILSRNQLAQKFYEEAVQLYIREDATILPLQTIILLQEALAFDPKLEDAYEALAVILGKHDQLDEAIALMKTLAALNPNAVMAHSNLSQFYVQQGNKELAEEEKAIALSIRMKLAAAEAVAESKQKEEAQKDLEETKRRMSMFEQVLAIDNEDFFANAGIGECLVQLKEYDKAIPYLKKAIILKASHMPSYLALSKAYKNSGAVSESKNLLEQAVELASKRGDTVILQQLRDLLVS